MDRVSFLLSCQTVTQMGGFSTYTRSNGIVRYIGGLEGVPAFARTFARWVSSMPHLDCEGHTAGLALCDTCRARIRS